MKNKLINITRNDGEIGNFEEFTHNFSGGKIEKLNDEIFEYYFLDIHFLQQESNTSFRVKKKFDNEINAKKYLLKFTKINPICEAIIKKVTEKEIMIYV